MNGSSKKLKVSTIVLIIVFILLLCSCKEKTTFIKGNLLFDLGADSFEDIESVELYGGCEITDKEDIELFSHYSFSPN